MTITGPDARSAAPGQGVVDAAMLVLERMGLTPADLLATPAARPPAPTFAEYIPVVSALVSDGCRKAYGSYWNRVTDQWGSRRIDEPTPSEIRQLVQHVRANVVAALTAGVNRSGASTDLGLGGPPAARTTGAAGGDRSAAVSSGTRTVRSWPLLVLAAPAAAEVWSGWADIAQKTGFGLVFSLPGILPSLHLDTSITLPVGVEAYAAYALRAWLAGEHSISDRTRRFAKWSAICSLALGMAGQVAYHLLAQAGAARAPWPVTTIVSCLPVLVLAMGTALAHMLRADAGADTAADGPDHGTGGPAVSRSPAWSAEDQAGAAQDQAAPPAPWAGTGPPAGTTTAPQQDHDARAVTAIPSGIGQARMAASRLAAAGRPVSRRALRSAGIRGSNQALNALARTLNAELAGTAVVPARPGNAVVRT